MRPPFASFLPGIAGPLGIPLWAFYVNRGQAMASFGVGSKDAAIMEFQPANKAYQIRAVDRVPHLHQARGSRTAHSTSRSQRPQLRPGPASTRRLPDRHERDRARRDRRTEAGLQVNVLYFTLPGEPFAGLVRQVTVKNLVSEPVELEILDGLPGVVPFGVNNDH